MIEVVCRFPGASSETHYFATVPAIGDILFLRSSGKIAVECIVEGRELTGVAYPNGYVDTSVAPSIVVILRATG